MPFPMYTGSQMIFLQAYFFLIFYILKNFKQPEKVERLVNESPYIPSTYIEQLTFFSYLRFLPTTPSIGMTFHP